jgi:CBS-domain-containing membrane protein
MKVGQLMAKKVQTVGPNDCLDRAACLMWEHDCGVTPVVDEQERLVGMLTDRDICMRAWSTGRALGELSAASAMSKNVVSCKPEDSLERAENLMRVHQVRRLPVTDVHGRICGVLSLSDLSREVGQEQGKTEREVSHREVAQTLAAVSAPRFA